MAGLTAARSGGRVGGRPRALTGTRLAHALTMAADGSPVWEIATVLGIGESTVYLLRANMSVIQDAILNFTLLRETCPSFG
ncbi:MAG: hypothetical protein QOE52_3659 [Mycobacterium sp.]|jgi:DNA invertase Pin-like site-specific DNA recombinase|nr:hypothetical protein [Mycobacterium sp.]